MLSFMLVDLALGLNFSAIFHSLRQTMYHTCLHWATDEPEPEDLQGSCFALCLLMTALYLNLKKKPAWSNRAWEIPLSRMCALPCCSAKANCTLPLHSTHFWGRDQVKAVEQIKHISKMKRGPLLKVKTFFFFSLAVRSTQGTHLDLTLNLDTKNSILSQILSQPLLNFLA